MDDFHDKMAQFFAQKSDDELREINQTLQQYSRETGGVSVSEWLGIAFHVQITEFAAPGYIPRHLGENYAA